MKFSLLILYLCFSVHVIAQQATSHKKILYVGAHPDDETAIAEVLIKYARLGYKVQIIIATDGKDGTRVTKIPAGDSLGTIRKEETRSACKIMGIEPPIFLGIERLDTKIGVGKYFAQHKKALDLLKDKLPTINPDLIITLGPDGDTHHSEHIVVGGVVTELLLQEGWVEKYPLYYLAWSKTQAGLGPDELGYVNDQYMNVKIDYSNEDELKALAAYKSYVTQYTPAEMEQDHQNKIKDASNFLFFRRFVVQKGMKNEFDFR